MDRTAGSPQSVRKDHTGEVVLEQGLECSEEGSHADIPMGISSAKAFR